MSALSPFHLAFPVHDLDAARRFHNGLLGCREGRSSDTWIDFDFYGHQIVAHYKPLDQTKRTHQEHKNLVDGHDVPVPHFGIILDWDKWEELATRLKDHNVKFIIEPYVRFQGQVGEQATMFFLDPSGNALEFKAFRDPTQIFAPVMLMPARPL